MSIFTSSSRFCLRKLSLPFQIVFSLRYSAPNFNMLLSRDTLFAFGALATLAVPASAFWRLPCNAPLVVERADPIVSPGNVSGHLHTIMGGNGFGFTMDYADTQESTCSSCLVTKDFSNYWVPELFYQAENGSFINVNQVGGATVYYL